MTKINMLTERTRQFLESNGYTPKARKVWEEHGINLHPLIDGGKQCGYHICRGDGKPIDITGRSL